MLFDWQVDSLGSRWNGSVDSFVSGTDVSEVSRLIRECSIDSDASDFSLDVSLNEGCGLNTLQVIERIEAEIDSVKNNCLEMNQRISTLHDVKNAAAVQPQLAHSTSRMDLARLHAERAPFSGLLAITAIADEVSDSSIASDSPSHLRLTHISSGSVTCPLVFLVFFFCLLYHS